MTGVRVLLSGQAPPPGASNTGTSQGPTQSPTEQSTAPVILGGPFPFNNLGTSDGNPFPFSPPPSTTETSGQGASPTVAAKHGLAPTSGVAAAGFWVLILLAGSVLLAGAGFTVWRLPRLVRLSHDRGVGALRLSSLYFSVSIDKRAPDAPIGHVRLRVAPVRAMRVLSRRNSPSGYDGTFVHTVRWEGLPRSSLTWTAGSPRASTRWWRAGGWAAHASLEVDENLARSTWPWERVLSASLGSAAAGRVAWTRYVAPGTAPYLESTSDTVGYSTPPRWARYLTAGYGSSAAPPDAIRIRHVVGRTVETSAGPRVEVDDGTGLLGPDELARGHPALVILQTEPSDDVDDTGNLQTGLDDLPEKLELAVSLMDAGTPAVLLLPPLPDSALVLVISVINREFLTRPGADPRVLRDELRQAIRGDRPGPMLDDFVLFVNASRYRFLEGKEGGP